ncbi:CGI-48 family protein [Schizosaccharomyces cryophilus OY26]|uniref:CGI-48 family protein n=1 Tax=Schizosaccharomyces cryophilus (strain OY26 / ATCC MYA-4695 / CBS 11777 / NBRC 106824 / NRRL Y48691) TaxID=653667 RepID=S9VTX9_SCHCR|nr:CGI-48 family protein [Schizosaccharomyces cryophilus OY26]EPY49634.1 CGI-48 family protein [Schizosaccharomyces cryophilus OY26]
MPKPSKNSSKTSPYKDDFLDLSTLEKKPTKNGDAKTHKKDAEELQLEEAIFGKTDDFESHLGNIKDVADQEMDEAPGLSHEHQVGENDLEKIEDADLFVFDTGENTLQKVKDDKEMEMEVEPEEQEVNEPPVAVWEDSDDERITVSLQDNTRLRKLRRYEGEAELNGLQYTQRLRQQFERIYGVPQWARPDEKLAGEDEEESSLAEDNVLPTSLRQLFNSSVSYVNKDSRVLLPGTIDIKRLKDANFQAPSHSGIRCISFHPFFPLLLTCGFDRTIRIYQLDGKVNPFVTSLHLRSSALQTAIFHPDGKHVVAGGRRKYMYIWDLESTRVEKISRMYGQEDLQPSMERFHMDNTGKYIALEGKNGYINLLNSITGQYVTSFKIEGTISDVTFTSDGKGMLVLSYGAEVWHFNLESRSVSKRWHIQDGVATTRFCLDGNDKYLAIGSKSGIVSVYDLKTPSDDDGYKQTTSLENVTFSINSMAFSKDSQVLAISSRGKKDTLRLFHVPSFSAFRNWPTNSTPLGRVSCLGFGRGGELCVGNEAGRVGLWKLAHYE